jgi:DNA-directed RNA polymerase specialized sigma24 family protein
VLAHLDQASTEIFVLFELEGLPLSEIALALDVPPPILVARLVQARAQFRKAASELHTLVRPESPPPRPRAT